MAKVLVVDDDKDFLQILATKLRSLGLEITTAENGEEGIEQAKILKPDLVLMDVKMPKLDGVAAMLKLKEDPATKNVRIVLLTAFGDPQPEVYLNDKRLAGELGAFEYLLKSQDLDSIAEKVKELLNH